MFGLKESQDKRLLYLSRVIVLEEDRGCIICGESNHKILSRHHVFMGADRSIWEFRYLPEYSVALCNRDHLEAYCAPHKNNKLFLEKLVTKIHGEKLELIMRYIDGLKPSKTEFPGYKELCGQFQVKIESMKSNWQDDIEPVYCGRDKDGNPQYRKPL